MVEAHAGKRGDEGSYGFAFRGAEDGGAASFVVIYEETCCATLDFKAGTQALLNFSDVVIAKGVVEAFVVGEMKSEIVTLAFAIPIDLGEPKEIGDGRDGFAPKFGLGRLHPRQE